MRYVLAAVNARFVHSCPALFAVRNEVVRHLPTCAVQLFQFTINDPYFATLQTIAGQEPTACFFSVYIWNADYIGRLVRDLTTILPHCPIILGGPQVSHGNSDWPAQCTIVRGEVEGLPPDFYRDLQNSTLRREYSAAPAPAFPLPYLAADFDASLRNRYLYYESTRGCPFNCSYCLSSIDKGIRRKDLATVQGELTTLLAHSPTSLRFVDRTFNADLNRALSIWRFLVDHAGDATCHFEIAPDLFNDEIFEFLATVPAGRFDFEIGLQTTNPDSLAAINRAMDPARAMGNIARLTSLERIHVHLDLILGLPFETTASFRASFNDAFGLNPHHLQMGLLKVLPGTELDQRRQEFGLLASTTPPYAVLATKWLTPEELRQLFWFGECVEAFFNNRYFRNFFTYLRQTRDDAFAFFERLLALCQAHDFFRLAPTQELTNRLLCRLVAADSDGDLLLEILRYDWLACGHRFLPAELQPATPLSTVRDRLWHQWPQSHPPLYDHATRNEFFKKVTFAEFSGRALIALGLNQTAEDGIIAFLPTRERTVLRHHQAVLLAPPPAPAKMLGKIRPNNVA